MKTVDVIIPVYHPGKEWERLLNRLRKQSIQPEHIFVLQTIDETEPLLAIEDKRVKVYPILKKDFDHGRTRAYGASLSEADYILFMTQDALPENDRLLERLLEGFAQERVGIAYARQTAAKNADLIEKLARRHNYPEESRLKTKADLGTLGIQTYFCSDVCAMYDRRIYEELGGFSYPTIFNEDMIMASKVIGAGYGVYYAARACVVHSHQYTCMQQFHRNFDLGVSQKQYHEVFDAVSSEQEGASFAKQAIVTLCKRRRPDKAVYFAWQCAFRLAGYRLGKLYDRLPRCLVLKCTASPGYFQNGE